VNIAILGAGAWGSALAVSLSAAHRVKLWTRARVDADAIARTRTSRYLPEIPIPAAVAVEWNLASALDGAELVLVATSTAGLRETATRVHPLDGSPTLAWACKGFETSTGLLPHQVLAEALPEAGRVGALSGPSFALEVARGLPTALVTRGLAEISRLGVAMGGRAETFNGLAGLGDLVLTCTGDLSRNREVGVLIARGTPLDAILAEIGHVAEGVHSARAARAHARDRGVEMPITEAVCAVLFEGREPIEAVQQLLTRDPRRE